MSRENDEIKRETGMYFAVLLEAVEYAKRVPWFCSLSFINPQKNNHKLSDEQQALSQGQNPLPIYMILNIKEDYSLSEFKGDGKNGLIWCLNYLHYQYFNLLYSWPIAFINTFFSSLTSFSISRLCA